MENRKMTKELTLEELEAVNGGIWDKIFEIIKDSAEIVDRKYIEPVIHNVVIVTNQIVDEAADEAVNLGYKIYDVI